MTELTQDSLEAIMLDIWHSVDEQGDKIRIRPKTILVPHGMQRRVRKIAYPHNILKRRKGIRGRMYTLKWRRKNAGLFTTTRVKS